MSEVDKAFDLLDKKPTVETLECVSTQIETLSRMLSREEMKTRLIDNMSRILKDLKYDAIRRDEAMLRLYKVLIHYSDNLKGSGISEQIFKKGHFNRSLKFYLFWAEECGKEKRFDTFKKVLKLARDALASQMSITTIEAGFRDVVDEYFNGEAGDLFTSPDDTMSMFRAVPEAKIRRRSSVCFLQQVAPKIVAEVPVFGPKTKAVIRRECIDSDGVYGFSPEEFRFAQLKDTFGEDVEPISRRDSGVVAPRHQPTQSDRKAREEVENRMNAQVNNPRRRHLSPLSEGAADDEEEKRSRIYSPLVATKDAHRAPLRNSTVENCPTITLSSDTKSSSAKDQSYNQHEDSIIDENEKLRLMRAGRSSSSMSSSSTRTAKSGGGLDLMAENEHLEAHAMFSDTVHLGSSEKTMTVGNDSIITSERARSTAPSMVTATDFSVLCDPDPTMPLHQSDRPVKKTSGGLNMIYDEECLEAPEVQKEVEPVKVKQEPEFHLPKKSIQTPPTMESLFNDDDDFLVPSRGMVTSTPAHNVPFVNVDDYFGIKRNEEDEDEEEKPKFVAPSSSTLQKALMRRKSQAASALTQASAPPAAPAKSAAPKVANSSIDCLSDNLGRRLSIGTDEIQNLIQDEAETTGIQNRRRSEIINKGDINPWDESLRKKLMGLVRPVHNMHDFPERAPKLMALRDVEVGGEIYHIQTLIGQGGYAKVYRAINEEKKTVAVKYEVPSCSWEVYICDQMHNRLVKDGKKKMAEWCVMKVIDAYVFSTASLLVNEYHEYGTLLEYANNMKDPNWHTTCFLINQMARILQDVHACKIIHGDIKPDNFMITRKIDPNWGKEALMSDDCFVIKLIDWGRAIDMMPLKDQKFKGRAGTDGFDSPEMIDGRSWNYQTDYFGFAASMALVVTGKYAKLNGDSVGNYSLNAEIKRRNILRGTINGVVKKFLNIPTCDDMPGWSDTIKTFSDFWEENFDGHAWRPAIAKFNETCDLVSATHK